MAGMTNKCGLQLDIDNGNTVTVGTTAEIGKGDAASMRDCNAIVISIAANSSYKG